MISYGDDGGVEGDNKGGGMLNSEMLGFLLMYRWMVVELLLHRLTDKLETHLNMIDDGDGNRGTQIKGATPGDSG